MATIRKLIEGEAKRPSRHSDVDGSVTFVEQDGVQYVQIDTFGSDQRTLTKKLSQSLRLDQKTFAQLAAFAGRHFHQNG